MGRSAREKKEDMMAVRKMQQIDAEIAAGKRKTISLEEFLEEYPDLRGYFDSKSNKTKKKLVKLKEIKKQ